MSGGILRLGVAGWGISSRYTHDVPIGGSHLERYARVFSSAEITTSFYRHHQLRTYARWAASVGEHFRFSVKTPQTLTHGGALASADSVVLERFVCEVAGLGNKLGAVLVQLPPSLEFAPQDASRFFSELRQRIAPVVALVCEPRHESWSSRPADALLKELGVARVAADPARWAGDAVPGGDPRLAYFRMHGSPRIYFSDYDAARLAGFAEQLRAALRTHAEVWCIFDNTAHGHALGNAMTVQQALETFADERSDTGGTYA